MAGIRRIVERMPRDPLPADWNADDVINVLESFRYREENRCGSHIIYYNRQGLKFELSTVHGRKVKTWLIRHLVRQLSLREWMEEETDEEDRTTEQG
jgi:predicted RNA binding protein YcfA (HicA-like mRNA interferase family)